MQDHLPVGHLMMVCPGSFYPSVNTRCLHPDQGNCLCWVFLLTSLTSLTSHYSSSLRFVNLPLQSVQMPLKPFQDIRMSHNRLITVLCLPIHHGFSPCYHSSEKSKLTAISLSAPHSLDVMPETKANRSETESHAMMSGSFSLRMDIATRNKDFHTHQRCCRLG